MQTLAMVSLVVADYDDALAFYVGKLGFKLVEDSFVPEQNKRWVVIEPPGAAGGAKLLLARGANPEQVSRIGNQAGGRVFLFLYTDDFWRDFNAYKALGIVYQRMGNAARAIDAYRKYLALAPKAPDAQSIRDRIEQLGGE